MLEAAGATVNQAWTVEISSLFALDANELREKVTDTLFVAEDQYFDA